MKQENFNPYNSVDDKFVILYFSKKIDIDISGKIRNIFQVSSAEIFTQLVRRYAIRTPSNIPDLIPRVSHTANLQIKQNRDLWVHYVIRQLRRPIKFTQINIKSHSK